MKISNELQSSTLYLQEGCYKGTERMMSNNIDEASTIFEHYVKYITNNISLYSHIMPVYDKSKAYSYIAERVYFRTFTDSYKSVFFTSFSPDLLRCQNKSTYVKFFRNCKTKCKCEFLFRSTFSNACKIWGKLFASFTNNISTLISSTL